MRAHQRPAGEFVSLEHLELGDAERALEQRRGGGVENLEIARIEDDAGGIAVAPADAHGLPVAQASAIYVLARRHAQRAVEADDLAVEIAVVDAVQHQRGVFVAAVRGAWETAPRRRANPAPPAAARAASACRRCRARSPARGCRTGRIRAPPAWSARRRRPSTRRRRPGRSGLRRRRPRRSLTMTPRSPSASGAATAAWRRRPAAAC